MINKTKCDSCGDEVANDQWSSYTSDDNAKWCIDCGDDIHNESNGQRRKPRGL